MKGKRIFIFLIGIAVVIGAGLCFIVLKLSDSDENQTVVQEHSYIEQSQLISAIEKVMPTVVSIRVFEDFKVTALPSSENSFDLTFDSEEVTGGSGFIVSSDGLVLTNKHLLEGKNLSYSVMLDGNEYPAKFVSEDPFDDVAVLKITPENGEKINFPVIQFGNSDNLKIGQQVLAIGNALALYGNTVTAGIISGKGREIYAFNEEGTSGENLSGLIQTDAAINFGNSGGPLVNLQGEVIGMNVAVAEFANNIGFALPINDLKPLIKSVEKYGEIVRPVLGVRFVMLSKNQAKELGLDFDYGAILSGGSKVGENAVIAGGSADAAGLEEGDIIIEVDGVKVDQNNSLQKIIRRYNPGDKVVLKVWRGGEFLMKDLVLKSNKDL